MHKLASYVVREGALPATDAVGWALRVCVTVEPLHRAGRPHGRISAKGLQSLGPKCEAAGFLLNAREMPDDMAYQSPERLAGAGQSASDDTWAVGVLLYVLLTAELPFAGTTAAQLQESISRGPAPLAAFGIDDARLQPVVDTLFQQSPSRRLAWLGDLRSRLLLIYPAGIALPPLKLGKPNLRIFEDDDDDDGEHKLTAVVSRDALWGEVRTTLAQRAALSAGVDDDDDAKPTEQLSRQRVDEQLRVALAQATRGAAAAPPPAPRRMPRSGPVDPPTPSSVHELTPPPSSSWPSMGTAPPSSRPQPSAMQPDAIQPDAIQPDAIEPDAIQPDAIQPDAIQPDAMSTAGRVGATAQPMARLAHAGAAVSDLGWDDSVQGDPSSSAPPSLRGPRPWEPGGATDHEPDEGLRAWQVLVALTLIALGGIAAYFVYRPAPSEPTPPAASVAPTAKPR